MAKNDKITTDGGPTLFNPSEFETGETWQGLEPQEPTPKDNAEEPDTAEVWAEVLRLLDALRDYADNTGAWFVNPPETLIRRGELYYNQHVDAVRRTMIAAGADMRTVHVVCRDYAGILSGTCEYNADAVQMQMALKALQPYEAFTIDRYGLYFGLLLNYSRFLLRFHDYNEAVKGVFATDETKHAFISGFYPAMDARAVTWLSFNGYLTASDFTGFDPSEMAAFFRRMGEYAQFADYTLYYVVARLALVATPEELADVVPPPHLRHTQIPITDFCEQVTRETLENLNRTGEKYAAAAAETHAEQEQARQAGKDWHDDTNARPVKIHENFGIVLSQPVNVSPYGGEIIQTLPVQRYIDEFNANPARFSNITVNGTVTEQSVQRVFEGLNLLPQYLSTQARRPVDGRFVFHTNLSEFAEICGYVDAGQAEKSALLGAMLILRNLYFVVDKPYKYHEHKDRKGRTRRKQLGGPTAIQFLNVPEIGLDTGELTIELYPECLKGTPRYIQQGTFKQMQARNKSTRQSRFNYQLSTKSHKSERVLIDKVFGLEDMMNNAKTEQEQKHVKTYIQNHRAEFRAKMLGWFAEYLDAGILTEFKREPSKTDKRDFILSWRCPDTSKLRPFDNVGEPDEQVQQ